MEIFDFPFHTPQDEYPGGSTIKFGRGYRFAARPPGPDEIVTHLNFAAMFVFQANAGDPPEMGVFARMNIYALEAFYKRHRMFQPFIYPHATLGNKICRFNKPLIMPKTIKSNPGEVGGRVDPSDGRSWRAHQVEPFDLEILLQP